MGIEIEKASLLFRASKDGFSAKQFHHLCDQKGPTLSLIKNDKGRIFGGFSSVPWRSDYSFSPDPHAFLFSLTTKTIHRLSKPLTDKALYMNGEFMMIYGCGDVMISNECNNKDGDPSKLSFSRLGQEYDLPQIGCHPLVNDQESTMFCLGGTH